MWQIANGLHGALEGSAPYLVQKQSKQDRSREADQQRISTKQQRIAQQSEKKRTIEEAVKVLQTYPLAAPDSFAERVILEGNLYAV